MAATWESILAGVGGRRPKRLAEDVLARAAVALILGDGQGGIELLFIRRAEHADDPWSGQVAFPGGRSEPGEDDLRTTAIRESREEIGVDLEEDARYIGALDELRATARLRPLSLAITPYVFRLARRPDLRLSHEVRSAHWLSLEALLDPACQQTFEYAYSGTALSFPCIRMGELVIWGLTYRMFLEFSSLAGAAP